MPGGYALVADANEVARTVLGKSSWAVLAMTCHVELFTQVHYRESIERDEELSDLYRDVFRFHWLEECQHAVMDEIEWCREDRALSAEAARRRGRRSDRAHLRCSTTSCCKAVGRGRRATSCACASGPSRRPSSRQSARPCCARIAGSTSRPASQHPHFTKLLGGMVTQPQMQRIRAAVAPIIGC